MQHNPQEIYSNMGIESLPEYIAFLFPQRDLAVFESFTPGNAYYTFRYNDFCDLLDDISGLSKTQLAQLNQNTNLTSPISGVVTARNYDDGDMYNGTPVLTVEQLNPVKLVINISESHFKDVKIGMPVSVNLDAYMDETFSGKVSTIYPTIDQNTHTFSVEVTISNGQNKVRPGMFGRASIDFGTAYRVIVPDAALVKQVGAGDRYVYVYKNGKVTYSKVEIGQHIGNDYEIISGVNPDDQIVIAGMSRLSNGKEVEVVK